jgi:hypothetical protein
MEDNGKYIEIFKKGATVKNAKLEKAKAQIIAEFLNVGATVIDMGYVGGTTPWLLVGWKGENFVVSVEESGHRYTQEERQYMEDWKGGEVYVVREFIDVRYTVNSWDEDERELEY